jgi:hypothetical protein
MGWTIKESSVDFQRYKMGDKLALGSRSLLFRKRQAIVSLG